jgi:hypothetical protein
LYITKVITDMLLPEGIAFLPLRCQLFLAVRDPASTLPGPCWLSQHFNLKAQSYFKILEPMLIEAYS